MARPRKEIDKKNFESMCAYQCTQEEICAFLGVTDKTLSAWCKRTYGMSFSEVFRQKREMGKISLRRKQWQLADKSASMAIFLGKNYLGQRDSIEYEDKDAINKLDQILSSIRDKAKGNDEDGA